MKYMIAWQTGIDYNRLTGKRKTVYSLKMNKN